MTETTLPPAGRLLRMMTKILNQKKTENVVATFAFKLTGDGGGEYSLIIDRGSCTFLERIAESPTVTITAPTQTWIDIATGTINMFRAIRSGLQISGNRLLMLRFNAYFSGDPVATTAPAGLYAETENEIEIRKGRWRQPKRILGLQASPRGKNGATEICYRNFESGLTNAGASVDTLYMSDLNIKDCTGCYACWKITDGKCVLQDDMAEILEKIPSYDLIVLAAPLYVDSIPSRLKSFIDRLIPLGHPFIFNKNGRCRHPSRFPRMPNLALLSVCGFYELDNFLPMVSQIEAASANMHMPLIATLLRPHAMILCEDIPVGPIEQVKIAFQDAGKELVQYGHVSSRLEKAVSRPLTSRSRFLGGAKTWWLETT